MKHATYLLIVFIAYNLFIQSYCNIECENHHYYDRETGKCQECHDSCKECNGSLPSNCIGCRKSIKLELCRREEGNYCKTKQECLQMTTTTSSTTFTSSYTEILAATATSTGNIKIILSVTDILIIVLIAVCIIIILALLCKFKNISRDTSEIALRHSEKVKIEMEELMTENNPQNKNYTSPGANRSCKTPISSELPFDQTAQVYIEIKDEKILTATTEKNAIPVEGSLVNKNVENDLIFTQKFSSPLENFKKDQLDWNGREMLNSGSFGTVYKCVYKNGNECYHVAVKESTRQTNTPFKEDQIMTQLNHPHIIKLITTKIDQNILLVMPLLKCSLSEFLHVDPKPNITHKIRYCQQIANGMSYLMTKRIVHCDLKASNVLVVDENLIQICDFGKSQKMGIRKRTVGTITHTAMELLDPFNQIANSEATDVWSFGVTIWEIFNTKDQMPYSDAVRPLTEITLLQHLLDKNHLQTNDWPSKDISESLGLIETYMKKCLLHDQSSRPTFDRLGYWFLTLLPEGRNLIYKEGTSMSKTLKSLM